MGILDQQIALAKERIKELRAQKAVSKGKSSERQKRMNRVITASRFGTVLALRLKGHTFKFIGQRLGVSVSRASSLYRMAQRMYRRRKWTPVHHRIEGANWIAWNCDEWMRHQHPASCVRKDPSLAADFHPLAGY